MICREATTVTDDRIATVSDQRRHARVKLPAAYTQVIVTRRAGPRGSRAAICAGHAYDLSLGGIRFELDQPLTPGEAVDLHLRLPGAFDQPIHVTGTCVRHHDPDETGPARVGVAFDRFCSRVDRAAIADYLQTHGPR